MNMKNNDTKEQKIPEHLWDAILQLLHENRNTEQPIETTVFRIAKLAYTAGLNAGLHTALSLCEETAHKIHATTN